MEESETLLVEPAAAAAVAVVVVVALEIDVVGEVAMVDLLNRDVAKLPVTWKGGEIYEL